MAAHSIGHNGQCHTLATAMRQDRHAILLFLAISLMLRGAGVNCYRHPSSLWAARLSRKPNVATNTLVAPVAKLSGRIGYLQETL
jgi:hypothetical protein